MDNGAAHVKAACRLYFDMAIDRGMKKPTATAAEERAARLAEALRANLRRRKAQARAADAPPPEGDPTDQ